MPNTTDLSTLLPQIQLETAVEQWIQNDMPTFDVGGLVVGNAPCSATLYMKSAGVLAGKPFVDAVFEYLNCSVKWDKDVAVEGSYMDAPTGTNKIALATVTGPTNALLQGERTALNALSRCSGVATASRNAVQLARSLEWKGHVAGTRKTTPGFGMVEKYGLLVGGAATHRLDLSQMVMLKDNHIWAAGSISGAVKLAKSAAGFSQKIEVECQSLEEAMEAASIGADIVMLDNFMPEQLKKDAAALKQQFPNLLIEASGGITIETMGDYLSEHVDIVSQGKLTQGYDCVDFSLKVNPITNYEHFYWRGLPDGAKAAATVLGYTEDAWDNDDSVSCEDLSWDELDEEKQQAAEVLGYNQENWD
jgi:nicotinate-nucleotide pyrophosphorylase (carboxylating)